MADSLQDVATFLSDASIHTSKTTLADPKPARLHESADDMPALLLNPHRLMWVTVSRTNPRRDLEEYLETSHPRDVSFLPDLALWTGDQVLASGQYNRFATSLFADLAVSAVIGDYAACDEDREEAGHVLGDPPTVRVFFGPCLITGLDDSSSQPAPLPGTFRNWQGLRRLTCLADTDIDPR